MTLNLGKIEDEFSVDTGGLAVADLDFYKQYGIKDEPTGIKIIDIPPGKYNIKYHVDCWLGKVKGEKTIEIPSGQLALGDAGYFFDSKAWVIFGEDTRYSTKHNKNFFNINTGGDGGFKSSFELEQIQDT